MKKAFAVSGIALCALTAVSTLTSCNNDGGKLKVGVVCIGNESATYDKNFMNALDAIKAEQDDVQVLYKKNTSENGTASKDAAVELAEEGCQVIIGNSFGFEANILAAAREYPDIVFGHCTGNQAHTANVDNYSNGFASIYEGRYLAGIAAGMKLNTLGDTAADHVLGYVGAFNYAEVISGYTAFYLGAKSVCSDVTMKVTYTQSWGDEQKESAAATNLIENEGCTLVSQHADSYGAPSVCDNKGVMNVAYNVSTQSRYPNTYLCYSAVYWKAYFEHLIDCARNNTNPVKDFSGSLADGAVIVGEPGANAAPGTKAAMDTAKAQLIAGTRKVFDCSTFTVDTTKNPQATVDETGHLTACLADVNDDGTWTKETQVVKKTGDITYYDESGASFRSAPFFDLIIDGITELGSAD